ncbi:MAG: hypothetical protein M9899_03400 [Bdellovibrionaceae bacterium]|nr:hypothetical protein [Pseudobdellovibrionaceae bacterium]
MLKSIKFYLSLVMLLSVAYVSVGCGGFSASNSESPLGSYLPGDLDLPPTGEDPDDMEYEGDGVYLTNLHPDISSLYAKAYFHADIGELAGSPGTSSARQGGSVVLTFEDSSGNTSKRYFSTGGSTLSSMEKNYWTKKTNGDVMWRGIFQGQRGAFVVIIDGVFMYGDGAGPLDTMSGSVWFRPWQVLENRVLPTHECVLNAYGLWDCKNQTAPIRQCWYISKGPYDCRFNISGDASTVTRGSGNEKNDTNWVKLGRFSNLNKSKVFHETY